MIFNNNTTSLGYINIPMAEGYNCSYGCALALVESARNDYAMFRAMLDADARELMIRNESSGYVAESQISALHESAVSGIWQKIKDLFAKLAAKIKAIFHSLVARLSGVFMDTKKMIKKYQNEVLRKTNIGNLEVKFRKAKRKADTAEILNLPGNVKEFDPANVGYYASLWSEDKDKIWESVTEELVKQPKSTDASDFRENLNDAYWEDDSPTTYQVKDIGGIREIITTLETMAKDENKIKKIAEKVDTKLTKMVRAADKKANEAVKDTKDADEKTIEGSSKIEVAKFANHAYDICVVYQDAYTVLTSFSIEVFKTEFAQRKAIFAKAAAANNDKLEEQYVYLNAVAEATEDQVEDAISGALDSRGGEYLASTSIAPTDIIGSGVSDDPNALVYDKDEYYSVNRTKVPKAGAIETDINSREESAFFGSLLY